MLMTLSVKNEKNKTFKRIKFCSDCKEFNYHKYILDYPTQIYICEECNKEEKIKSYFKY